MSPLRRFINRTSRLIVISTVGSVLLVAGIALSFPGVPGPGLLLIIAGLAVLSKEFAWAQRLTARLRERAQELKERALQRFGDNEHQDDDGLAPQAEADHRHDGHETREPAA